MITTPIELTYAIPKELIPQFNYFKNPYQITQQLLQWIKLAIKLDEEKITTYITAPEYPLYTNPEYIDNFIQLAITLWKLLPRNLTNLQYLNEIDNRVRFKLTFKDFNKWEQPDNVKNHSASEYLMSYPRPNYT